MTGSVLNAQLEAGGLAGFITSYIPTTAAAVTRAFDNCYIAPANTAPWFASPGGSWFAEFVNNVPTPVSFTSPRVIGIHDGNVFNGVTSLFIQPTNIMGQYDAIGVLNGTTVVAPNTIVERCVQLGAGHREDMS